MTYLKSLKIYLNLYDIKNSKMQLNIYIKLFRFIVIKIDPLKVITENNNSNWLYKINVYVFAYKSMYVCMMHA